MMAFGIDSAMDRRRPALGFPEKLIFDEYSTL
jgi:hypothetical protein